MLNREAENGFAAASNRTAEKVLIGIDGGGTKTEFILFTETGKILHKRKASRSNPNDIGLEHCCSLLAEEIDKLMEIKGSVCSIFAGIAGCSTGDNGKLVETFLKSRYPSVEIVVDTDGANILSCNLNVERSMALICGTGSVLFVRENGRRHRIGGWGYLFDEAGSAYDIGKDAIRAALAQLDGMGQETLLTAMLNDALQGDVWESLNALYQKGKAFIASLAPLVFQAYALGDVVAEGILRKNAARLSLLINTAIEKYDCGRHVVACGGLIENCTEVFLPMIEDTLAEKVEFIFPSVPPVYGACVESCRIANIAQGQDFYETFSQEYWRNEK